MFIVVVLLISVDKLPQEHIDAILPESTVNNGTIAVQMHKHNININVIFVIVFLVVKSKEVVRGEKLNQHSTLV
jgi:hypothetical protein